MDSNIKCAAIFDSINTPQTDRYVNWGDIKLMIERPQEVCKSNASCFAPQLSGKKTKEMALKLDQMTLLWVDIDEGGDDIEVIEDQLDPLDCTYIIYSTASSERLNDKGIVNGKRWRVLILPSKPLTCDQWINIQQRLTILLDGDSCNDRLHQPLYAPNNPKLKTGDLSRHYDYKFNEGNSLDVDNLPEKLPQLKAFKHQRKYEEIKNNHRRNISPVVNIDYSYGESTLKGTKADIETAFTDEIYQRQILKFLGFKDFERLFSDKQVKVRSILHDDNSKSGGLLISKTRHVLFHDFAKYTNNKHIPLNDLYASLINRKLIDLKPYEKEMGDGQKRKVGRVSAAVWGLRLLIEAGVVKPCDVELLPPPNHNANTIKIYKGIKLLFQVRWAYSDRCNEPITMGREFIAVWCGVSENIARTGIKELLKADVIQTSGKHGRAITYKLGEYTMQCSCGGGMVESSHEIKSLNGAQDWSKHVLNKHLPIKVEKITCKGCGRLAVTILSNNGIVLEKRG